MGAFPHAPLGSMGAFWPIKSANEGRTPVECLTELVFVQARQSPQLILTVLARALTLHERKTVRQNRQVFVSFIGLTPQSGEHRYNLLLAAHDAGQEEHVILGLGGEGAADGVVAADVEKLGALEEDVGEHEDNDIVAVI